MWDDEVILTVDSADVYAKNRKLKATWSVEAQQDLRAVHNIDAEGKLMDMLAKEIQAEIDAEILKDLANNIGGPYVGGNNYPQPHHHAPEVAIPKKKKKQYRSIDDPWES